MLWVRGDGTRDLYDYSGHLPAMKRLLLVAIRLYWRSWPRAQRRKCLFRRSCSHHVYHVTRTRGFTAGIRSLVDRLRKCRPGYTVYSEEGRLRVRLADGSSIDESEAAPHVVAPYSQPAERLQRSLKRKQRATRGRDVDIGSRSA